MTRALAYCGFRDGKEISLPATGVNSEPVRLMDRDGLRLLWSEVEWPFESSQLQKRAVEFHQVVSQVFQQTAVVPFRLLSVFADEPSLVAFVTEHAQAFLEDLKRLNDFVQMECVLYPSPDRAEPATTSGTEYLRRRAGWVRSAQVYANAVHDALGGLSHEARTRETKNGSRVFALVNRGNEVEFRRVVSGLPVPEHLSRRISGPWPASEFLSEGVRAPQMESTK
ncbi:MAG TPA: GvpL/GvpF family gas vesicle protein [Candidatus Angelobacter sp.]|nr:GvpL/GvpF family gas vesicle protein [Candidatus Angelobacter sp.]